jgi:asparagine synthase (glutamine-hydrolysing)
MASSCGRFVMAYNGEVYNAQDLKVDLEKAGRRFRGHSDTEVILEGCAVWGVEEAVKRAIGMFAFAVWDRQERRLSIVRDRLGIKPLFWSFRDGLLIFGSELKSLRAHPGFRPNVDRNALASYLRHMFVPAPHCIYEGVSKLEPGRMLTLEAGGAPKISTYWSLLDVADTGQDTLFRGSEDEAIDSLDALLGDAISRRMVADVPLGAFLSGGIDSSTVVALMQAKSEQPVRTYSIGYESEGFNEAEEAAAIASHLGTDHLELYATSEDARAVIPSLPVIYDEPFADSSQIPTYLVSKLTRQHVTVALSGDGGDEVFGGYTRYFIADRFGWALFRSPQFARRLAGCAVRAAPPRAWDVLARVLPHNRRPPHMGEQLHKLGRALGRDPNAFYRSLASHWTNPEFLVSGAEEYRTIAWDDALSARIPDPVARMQLLDTATYLPEDILAKVDRASMAVALEVRVPILDHRVVEFAWSLPRQMKVRDGQGKWILRQLLRRYVPDSLIKRQKQGFSAPVAEWLRGPLKDWAGDMLSSDALNTYGLVNPKPVNEAWRAHLSGHASCAPQLWSVLMLQTWCEEYLG